MPICGMPLPAGVVVRVVGRRHLHAAGAERRVGEQAVGDDRDLAVHERDRHRLADEVLVALVGRDARTRRCRRASSRAAWSRSEMNVAGLRPSTGYLNVQKPPLRVLGVGLVVGHGGLQVRVPVHEPLAAEDEPSRNMLEERLAHGPGADRRRA